MIKILHTADWHLGQLFYGYDRTFEHEQFLHWLKNTITELQVDVVLLSGDVFDLSNPAAVTIKLFYSFLQETTALNPNLQIIVTAGNHDSASRLESPKPLLVSTNIHIIGFIERDKSGSILFDKLMIPITDKNKQTKAWCMAVPFLRMGDYPICTDSSNPYAEGVTAFYKEAYHYVKKIKHPNQALLAMGHLHVQKAEISGMDDSERFIMGGVESLSADAFDADIAYVALGHIHKAQKIGGKEHIRYSGSPLPMSFSEIQYKHQVVIMELEDNKIQNIASHPVPVSVPLLRVPAKHQSLSEVLLALAELPNKEDENVQAPYLEVRVILHGPEPGLRHKIEEALEGKQVRLTRIDTQYAKEICSTPTQKNVQIDTTIHLDPTSLLQKVFAMKYNNPLPDNLQKMFQEVCEEIHQMENKA